MNPTSPVASEKKMTQKKNSVNVRAMCAAHMVKLLVEGEHSRSQLGEKIGLHHETVQDYVESFRRKRLVRISSWQRGKNNGWVPIYSWNEFHQPDAPKPGPMTRSEVCRRYRAKKKLLADPLHQLGR